MSFLFSSSSRRSSKKSVKKTYANQEVKINELIHRIKEYNLTKKDDIINNWLTKIERLKTEFQKNQNDGYDDFIRQLCIFNNSDSSNYVGKRKSYIEYTPIQEFIKKQPHNAVYQPYLKCKIGLESGGKTNKRRSNKKKRHTRRRKV